MQKNAKNEDFFISSIISTAVEFLSFMLFSYLLQCVIVICNEIGFKSCVFQCMALFLRFCVN